MCKNSDCVIDLFLLVHIIWEYIYYFQYLRVYQNREIGYMYVKSALENKLLKPLNGRLFHLLLVLGSCRNGCNLPFRSFQQNFLSPMEHTCIQFRRIIRISAIFTLGIYLFIISAITLAIHSAVTFDSSGVFLLAPISKSKHPSLLLWLNALIPLG